MRRIFSVAPYRVADCVVGSIFVFSSVAKAADLSAFAVQVAQYGIVRDAQLVYLISCLAVAVETLVGAALLLGLTARTWARIATLSLLVGFSAVLIYAWRTHGLSDCGCFGKYIKMTPAQSLLKNVVLLGLVVFSFANERRVFRREPARRLGPATYRGHAMVLTGVLGTTIAVVVLAICVHPPTAIAQFSRVSPDAAEFARFTVPSDSGALQLAQGEYLVAFLSTTCEHCQQATRDLLNDAALIPECPKVVALMLGDEETMKEFRKQTEATFPTALVEPLIFFQFIGQAPPRLVHVRDGRQVGYWDEPLPDLASLVVQLAGGQDNKAGRS